MLLRRPRFPRVDVAAFGGSGGAVAWWTLGLALWNPLGSPPQTGRAHGFLNSGLSGLAAELKK